MNEELLKSGFILIVAGLFLIISNSSKIKLIIIRKLFKSKSEKIV